MRSANLFLLLGTIGFLNVYEDLMGDDDTGKLDPSDAKRLQRKYGVKEKRSAVRGGNPQRELREHFEDYSEELVEFMKRPVFRGLSDCREASETACNCLKLICFGQVDCTLNITSKRKPTPRGGGPDPLQADDPRYVYYMTSRRLRARHNKATPQTQTREVATTAAKDSKRQQFYKCRQTTINPYVLCECKKYTRLGL